MSLYIYISRYIPKYSFAFRFPTLSWLCMLLCWRLCFWQCRAAFNAGVKSTPSEAVSMINSNTLITTFSLKSFTRWSSLLGAAIWKTKTSPQRVIPPVSYLLQGDFFSSLFQKLSKLCFGTAHRINCFADHPSSTAQTMPADGLRSVERRRLRTRWIRAGRPSSCWITSLKRGRS